MRNKIAFILVGILLASLLAACGPGVSASLNASGQPEPARQTTPAASRTISVSGSGRVSLTPDLAYINIGVHTENQDVSEALAANNSQAQKLVDTLKAAGVDAKDIQTSSFNIYPQQQFGPNGEITGTRYVVDNTVYVTVRSLSQMGKLLETAVASGANTINGISFDLADKTEALSDARKQAVDNARVLAEEMAEAAGVELGEIQSINVISSSMPVPMYDMYGRGAAQAAAEVPISSGQMTVSADVSVVYTIE